VHVADVTHPNLHEHMRVVDETLKSLELAGRPRLLVLNQADRLRGEEGEALREALSAEFPAAVFTSALKDEGLDTLRTRLGEAASAGWKHVKTTLPYHAGALVQQIRTRGSLKSVDYEEAGIRIDASVPPELAAEIHAAVRRR
jgi:GTP-binding protein HflX